MLDFYKKHTNFVWKNEQNNRKSIIFLKKSVQYAIVITRREYYAERREHCIHNRNVVMCYALFLIIMDQDFYDMVEANPVIAAIKDMDGLEKCCHLEELKVIFVLFGDICNIGDIVKRIRESGKLAIVHVDLITGLSPKEIAVDFIRRQTGADGIISTKPVMIRKAKELGMYTVMRFFVLDSISLDNISKQLAMVKPDFIEVLPGVMPKIICKVCKKVKTPVIAGGLITDKEDIVMALDAGAIAVSSTNQDVWMM